MESNRKNAAEQHENVKYSNNHYIFYDNDKYVFDGDSNKIVIFHTDDLCAYIDLKSIKKEWGRGDNKEFRYKAVIATYWKDSDAVTEKMFYIMMKSPGYRSGDAPTFIQYSTDKKEWTMITVKDQDKTAKCMYAAGKKIAEKEHLENIIALFQAE